MFNLLLVSYGKEGRVILDSLTNLLQAMLRDREGSYGAVCGFRWKSFRRALNFDTIILFICRSQWPRGLRRRSTAARLLRLWVRIPPEAWMFVVSVVCCQVEVSATDLSLVQRSPTDCGASLCVIKKPRKRGG